jgi:multidrug transporter EmrE-like cation transporter
MVYLALSTSILLGASGHILCKTALGQGNLINIWLLAGVACYGFSFLCFLPWIGSRPVGIAVPAASLTYIVVNIWDWATGANTLSLTQLIGLAMIVGGLGALNYRV